jgi:S-(hydroxymethyl)glutathione dehydrogenase/alcohol dehydrogenase
VKAAVLTESGQPFEIRDDVELFGPNAEEVRVKVVAAGICGSDVSQWASSQTPVPAVLGHEAAGIVTEVGDDVRNVRTGDHVILGFLATCGWCPECVTGHSNICRTGLEHKARAADPHGAPRLVAGGLHIHRIVHAAFAEEVVVRAEAAIKLPAHVPFDVAALLGCGVLTGTGAALNTAQVQPGSTVAVMGCGAVGISVIQGARIAGAAVIMAIDPVDTRRRCAERFGATHSAAPGDATEMARALTGTTGFDYVFEVSGRAFHAAFDLTRRGGALIPVGVGQHEVALNLYALTLREVRILGCFYGSSHMARDYPRLLRLWEIGKLEIEGLITSRIDIAQLNDAFGAMRDGEGLRSVITFPEQ